MSATANFTASRPKVHRLPIQTSRVSRLSLAWNRLSSASFPSFTAALAAMMIILTMGWMMFTSPPASLITVETPPLPSLPAGQDASITIGGKGSGIVGQLAHVPPDNVASAEISSTVDKDGNRDLLSIISKY